MLHQSQKFYENHQLIIDHLDNHHHVMSQDVEDHVQSTQFYKKSNISSTSSPEPHYVIQPIQQYRVIKDGRQIYEDGFRVSSSESMNDNQMGPPPTPNKNLKIISNEEPTSSIPDLGKSNDEFFTFSSRQNQ